MSAFRLLTSLIIIMSTIVFLIYALYYLLVLRTNGVSNYVRELERVSVERMEMHDSPCISVVMPVHNEEAVIAAKLRNLGETEYPKDRLEIIIVDDCSNDLTVQLARESLERLSLSGRIIENRSQIGVNSCYNVGIREAQYGFIMTTDADVMTPKDSVKAASRILTRLEKIGGVCGIMVAVSDRNTLATRVEHRFREAFEMMGIAESSIFATFPGHTNLTLFRKSLYSPMPEQYGCSDGNISLSIIGKGFRFILAPNVVFYEPISQEMQEQKRQKIRRASRLIQSTVMNWRILFSRDCGRFGRVIFPLRLLMQTICPVFIHLLIPSTMLWMYLLSPIWLLSVSASLFIFLVVGLSGRNRLFVFPVSFLIHQMYLTLGLLLSLKRGSSWRHIDRFVVRTC